ncbi:T9SS type A sorting domain-containing protein [Chryseobacterium sp. SNU WT5]|uniref:GEVED domain-containing protein n=1 Tax=Chryseobacterium sp. SNU WT5 TaxID=2594269 RepID=UPI00117EFB8B|nr:GEVED domain-containing protein [Chryseobacterium sp. SNU WT5]QDP84726.1 T9SS type A sorting domain-containing protein [Chryseobacterium sp. SNU WT5]
MKKHFTLLTLLLAFTIFAQTCGFDQVQNNLEKQFPQLKKDREAADAKLLNTNVKSYLNKIGATSKAGQYTGTIYEIPVVIHVITSSDPSNSSLSLTDEQIKTWIENCNKMYAATYGNGYAPEGSGSLDGNVIPIKLVLAKRSPSCASTSGIVRYDGSTIAGYDQNGVNSSNTNGASTEQIRSLAPHWPEQSYFNIYVILGFDGDKSTYGLMGWCGYPTNPDAYYESFMKVKVVTNVHDSTLAHEFGHGMGLKHTFEGANASPTNNPPLASDCPVNNNCASDNDMVCDTEAGASLLRVYPTPTNSATNPCTGTNYAGVQYNVMNYTNSPRKFTAGQRDRALAIFMQYRGNLTRSLGGTDLSSGPAIPAALRSSCTPPGVTNLADYGMGPRKVTLGNIVNSSEPLYKDTGLYYVDYSLYNCFSTSVYTDIPDNSSSNLSVEFGTNPQFVKAWIDYNDNGVFETSELIGGSAARVPITSSPYVINFTPPANAVKGTYLRMRVIVDYANTASCGTLQYGQAEDYSVRIINPLSTSDNNIDNSESIIFIKNENKIQLVTTNNKEFGDYEIYDMTGKIIQKGKSKKEIILKTQLTKGMYIVKYDNKSKKFMN